MPIQIYFDTANMPEKPTLILAKRDGTKIGKIEAQSLKIKDDMTSAPELYFEISKFYNGVKNTLWDDINNFKLIWCKESDIWFDVQVDVSESNETKKSVTCKGLGHSELSQINLYDIEINTEDDIARDDYIATVLYNPNKPEGSLLNRILEKAPHYSIGHVDASIQEEQRTFSFSGTSIYDALLEIGEELECIFDIHIGSDKNGEIIRTVNVYDLLNSCVACGHRESGMTICSECGSTNILEGYGEDTTIFVASEELAEDINIESDVDSVKNCFRLTAGDDLMTATVRECNPNGSSYIWYIPEYMRSEMSNDLKEKLSSYDEVYEKYQSNTNDTTLVNLPSRQKQILEKYSVYSGETKWIFNNNKYVAHCFNTTSFAIGGWFNIYNNDTKAYDNYPLICTMIKNSWNYTGNGTSYLTSKAIIVNEQEWYYSNCSDAVISGDLANCCIDTTVPYLGKFDTIESAAQFLILNYCNGSLYNLIIYKYDSLLDIDESKKNISVDSKHEEIKNIDMCLYNYPNLMTAYYNTIDFTLLLESSLMPSVNIDTDNGIDAQVNAINALKNTSFAISNNNLETASDETLLLAAKNYIKYHISSNYKITVSKANDNFRQNNDSNIVIIVNVDIEPYSSLSDEEIQTIEGLQFEVNNDNETFVKKKIDATLYNASDDNKSDIVELFNLDDNDFCYQLQLYSYNRLESFDDACQSCLDIITSHSGENESSDDIYSTYYNKKQLIENEMAFRQSDIDSIAFIQEDIITLRDEMRILLDFKNHLGDTWKEFSSYRRDDEYSNSNYISDGLDNAELFSKALEFIKVANREIHKAAIVQHTISTTLKDLLVIPRFKPLVEHFEVGNWIRVKIDDTIYKLRLVSYELDYDNLLNISVEFSDVTTSIDSYTDIQDIISRAESMASSYDYIARQAKNGNDGKLLLNNWVEFGLDATNVKFIGGADNQTQTWDEHGMLFREYLPLEDAYDDRQLKIINSTLAITDNNWKNIRTAIGRFLYKDPVTNELIEAYGVNAETIVGKLILGEQLGIYNSGATLQFNENGLTVKNKNATVSISPSDSKILNITNINESGNTDTTIFSVDNLGNGTFSGTIYASGGKIGNWNIEANCLYNYWTNNGVQYITGINNGGYGAAFYAGGSTTDGNDAPFRVYHSGEFCATQGQIGFWNVGKREDGAPSLWTIANGRYCGMNGYGYGAAFYAGATDAVGHNSCFSVSHAGELYAYNATIVGNITANTGVIGGFTINQQQILKSAYVRCFDDVDSSTGGALLYTTGIQAVDSNAINVGDSGGATISHPVFYTYQSKFEDPNWVFDCYTFYVNNRGFVYAQNEKIEGVLWVNGMQFCTQYTTHNNETKIRDTLLCHGAFVNQTFSVVNNITQWYNQYYDCNKVYISSAANTSLEMNGDIKTNGINASSDENYKELFEINDKYEVFFDALNPVLYKYKLPNQNFHRKHMGFGAQSVEKALNTAGINTEDFAGFIIEKDAVVSSVLNKDGSITTVKADELYQLRYDEFIALNTYMIQKTRKQLNEALVTITDLQNQINELKAMVN